MSIEQEPSLASGPREWRFDTAEAQANALAAAVTEVLTDALHLRAQASLVVSGGKTPARMFAQLATAPLDWSRVHVTLADERWVEPTSDSSNEHLVRTTLLAGAADKAVFVGLKSSAPDARAGLTEAWRRCAAMPQPFDQVLLGIGDDGHFASLFPGATGLADALDEHAEPACVAITPLDAPFPRISLNFAALLQARCIRIQICGAGKWEVYQRALEPGPFSEMPIRAVLRQRKVPVDVYWSP
ncbi:MAG: 6-phosphogluconolactonase [Steroidobacteraceae bacterium]|jgi:6-phosphogluconolactonase